MLHLPQRHAAAPPYASNMLTAASGLGRCRKRLTQVTPSLRVRNAEGPERLNANSLSAGDQGHAVFMSAAACMNPKKRQLGAY